MKVAAALLAAALALSASTARANDSRDPSAGEASSEFWRDVREPGWRRSRTLIRHGLVRIAEAMSLREHHAAREALLESAIVRFERAHRLAPRDPEALYALAMAFTLSRNAQRDPRRVIAIFERLRRLDPEMQAARVAFELGILHTRLAEFDRAAEEYRRALARRLDEPSPGSLYVQAQDDRVLADVYDDPSEEGTRYNLAEVVAAGGDLEEAAREYRRAVDLSRAASNPGALATQALALWGLAVTLDRLGEHANAIERAAESMRVTDGSMEILRHETVFFVPPYEVHWAEALGYLARAGEATAAEERRRALEHARRSWESFLEEGGSASRWADAARAHVDALRRELEPEPARRPEARRRRDPD